MAGEVIVSGVVRGVLSSLSSPVLNEFWLLRDVEEEKEKLRSNLSAIEAVLQDAERRQVNDKAVQDWLLKIRTAAYDAEDVLDEFRIEALRREVENRAAGMREKVGNLFYTPVFRFKMARKMQKLRKKFDSIAIEKSQFHLTMVGVADGQPMISRPRETCSKIDSAKVYGRDNEKADLIDLLIKSENEEDLSVIPIVGMGGLGKTTLAQLVYNDQSVVSHFHLRMWVYVSESFDMAKLLKEILESAIKKKADQLSMEILQNQLQEELSGKRYLLVLDDVWNDRSDEWDRLKALLTCGASGSKILVTTRSYNVAEIIQTVPRPRLRILSNEDSWSLFKKLANPPPTCEAIGKEMVKKCGGLPLAIKTLGGLMSFRKNECEWESVRDSQFWNQKDNGGEIIPTLRFSYDQLTSSLKQCFAYCAVIPKGRGFDKSALIKQWIAHGFISLDEENEPPEEKGDRYFNELLQRSLIDAIDGRSYMLHDLIHDLLRFVAGEECFIVEASMDTVPKETRHLTLQDGTWASEPKNLEALKKCNKLHSFLALRDCFVDINACLFLTCLRVLVLRNTYIGYLPNSIDKLKHLRYLDVSETSIRELPEAICNLHSLQTLRINGYVLRMLPKNMKRMINLRHIEYGKYLHYHLLPKGIGELTCLRTLSTFVVGGEGGAGIEELKGLNQLQGDFHIRELNRVRNGNCASEANLRAKKHLHSLRLSWASDDDTVTDTKRNSEEVIEKLEPHSRLKKLAVEKYMGMKFPIWIEMLTNLTDIELRDCNSCEHLPPLWQLPVLESLKLERMSAVKYIIEFDGSDSISKDIFPSLKYLTLTEMHNLEGWSSQQEDGDGDEQGRERDEQVIFQGLHTMEIYCCPKLICIPWLRHVSSLNSLRLQNVGCNMIEIPASQSLMKLKLFHMPNLERLSLQQEADYDDRRIVRSRWHLGIYHCPKLISLPLLSPALEMSQIIGVGCDQIESSASPSLQSFELIDMPNLERLSLQESNDNEQVVLPPSAELRVENCPMVWAGAPIFFHHLKVLHISESNEMLLGSVANCTSLDELCISGFSEVEYLPEELGLNLTGLRILEIKDCPKLASLSNQLEKLLALKQLTIERCNDLVLSLPNGLQQQQQSPPLNSLEELRIINSCEKQISLPGDGIVPLTSLKRLTVMCCGNLESISADMLQNFTSLEIGGCPKLSSLDNLKSMESLTISNCSARLLGTMKSLTSLTTLRIFSCPSIRSLPEAIGELTMLYSLTIRDCPGITSLPKGLQRLKNLRHLHIVGCPVLKRKLRSHNGEDWHKVAHVQKIQISR